MRCYDCATLVPSSGCPDHPQSDVIRWGRREFYAWFYLSSAPVADVFQQFDATLTERDPQRSRYFPGVTRDDLERVSWIFERWGGVLPEMGKRSSAPASPRGLFG